MWIKKKEPKNLVNNNANSLCCGIYEAGTITFTLKQCEITQHFT